MCVHHQSHTLYTPLHQSRSVVEAGFASGGVPRGLSYIFSWGLRTL
jgi:hypothetical protein